MILNESAMISPSKIRAHNFLGPALDLAIYQSWVIVYKVGKDSHKAPA
jgi:hypothetical protein